MKPIVILSIFLILFSYAGLAYSGSQGGVQWRLLPSTGSSTTAKGNSFNSGDYPGTNFSNNAITGYFEAYDLPGPSGGPTPTPTPTPPSTTGTGGGGRGGAGYIRNTYTILVEENICVQEPTTITVIDRLNKRAQGIIEIFYKRNNRWIQNQTLPLKQGQATFTPTKVTQYKIKFGNIEKIINAQTCIKAEKKKTKKQQQPEKQKTKNNTKKQHKKTTQKAEKENPIQIKDVKKEKTKTVKELVPTFLLSLIILSFVIAIIITQLRKTKDKIILSKPEGPKEKTIQTTEELNQLMNEIKKLRKRIKNI